MGASLGNFLRRLRAGKNRGLKQAAPEIGVSYTYLSKLENGLVQPSQETTRKLAAYYDVNAEILSTLAGHLPEDVLRILQEQPEEAVALLRKRFGNGG